MGGLNWKRIGLHAFFWGMYIPVNAALSCLIQGLSIYEYFQSSLIAELVLTPVKMSYVYFIFYFVIPLYIERSKWFLLILISMMGLVLAAIIYRLVDSYVYLRIFYPNINTNPFEPVNIILALFDLFITSTAATTIKMVRVQYASAEYEKELIREKLSAELDFLRAQTNPHFLFNTLNNLYGLARKKSDQTPDAILKLSKIMRFMLYDCRVPRIQIAGEVKVIKDYIELERLRYSDRLQIIYTEQIDNPGTLIAPLLLLPFIENSFKHGAHSSTDQAEIRITLILRDNELTFSVHNTFEAEVTAAARDPKASGIGMRNELRQLELIYPNRHKFSISDSDGWYKTDLYIDLNLDNSTGKEVALEAVPEMR